MDGKAGALPVAFGLDISATEPGCFTTSDVLIRLAIFLTAAQKLIELLSLIVLEVDIPFFGLHFVIASPTLGAAASPLWGGSVACGGRAAAVLCLML